MISCFFGTGTGRCGTMMLAKLLNCSDTAHCNHEHSVRVDEMKRAYHRNKPEILVRDSHRILVPTIQSYNDRGKIYGEINSHLYLLYPELFRRYEYATRFILLVRQPDEFIRSALARGFFSPDHPHACEHVIPPRDTEMGRRWQEADPFEKCAWYWAMVNGFVYRFFLRLPNSLYRIVLLESIDVTVVEKLYNFLSLPDFADVKPCIEQILAQRHNASPGQNGAELVNPYSKEISLKPKDGWNDVQVQAFERHVLPTCGALYKDGGLSYISKSSDGMPHETATTDS